jgi:hypothetical protein
MLMLKEREFGIGRCIGIYTLNRPSQVRAEMPDLRISPS